jgi:glycosidase
MMIFMDKMIVYQVLPRLFGNLNPSPKKNGSKDENGVGRFSAFSPSALAAIKALGVTHIWYTGVIEHATQTDYTAYGIQKDHADVVKGKAGSPYAIKDYYDVDPDLADNVEHRMEEFEALVKRTHEAGMKVIMDFVPNHVAREYHSDMRPPYVEDLGQRDDTTHGFLRDNNFYYIPNTPLQLSFVEEYGDNSYSEFPAKVTGNDCFSASPGKNDWYETVKLNYGVDYTDRRSRHFEPTPNTWTKMLHILMYWAGKGVDGFRCDMAEMVPVEFWGWAIPKVKEHHEVCFIAEVYNPAEYHSYIFNGHFDYLYDKVGLYDTLRAVMCGNAPASSITHCWQALEGIRPNMLNFLENHDEQRIASRFFAGDARKGIPGMIVSAMMYTNPVMLYCGQELGEEGMDEEGFSGCDGRTTIFDYWSINSLRRWIGNGKFDGEGLSTAQRALREMYSKILNVAKTEPAIIKGDFFDLMYANGDNPCFDTNRQYAFLRKLGNDVVMVVANFDEGEHLVRLRVPEDAFRVLGFGDNKAAVVTDLLSGETCVSTLTTACPYQLTLPAYSGRVLRFTFN